MMCVGLFSGYPYTTARVNSWLSVATWQLISTLLQSSPQPSLCLLGTSHPKWLHIQDSFGYVKCLKSSWLSFYVFPPLQSFFSVSDDKDPTFHHLLQPRPSSCMPSPPHPQQPSALLWAPDRRSPISSRHKSSPKLATNISAMLIYESWPPRLSQRGRCGACRLHVL